MKLRNIFKKKTYLSYDKYSNKIDNIDNILFINDVAKQSLRNKTK